jgi:hypothetical protein
LRYVLITFPFSVFDSLLEHYQSWRHSIELHIISKDSSTAGKTSLSESSTAPPLSQSPSNSTVAPPLSASTRSVLDSSQENPNVQVDKPDSEPLSQSLSTSAVSPLLAASTKLVLDSYQEKPNVQDDKPDSEPPSLWLTTLAVSPPLAASTTLMLDSSQENPNVQGDKPDSEPENHEGDDLVLPETPHYKIGMLIIKEVDNISCIGVIQRVAFGQKMFFDSVRLDEVHLKKTIHEDEMKIYVFSSDKWIVMKDLNVFVTFNMVRLSDQLVNNNSLIGGSGGTLTEFSLNFG